MKNVSNLFQKDMDIRRDFYCQAEITFSDGTVKALGRDDFAISGNSYTESAGGSSFPLGQVVSKSVALSLNNYDDRWSNYDFQWAKVFLKTKFDLSNGTTESINIGNFTVITPESYGIVVDVTAVDDSYKLDKEYVPGIPYPASLGVAIMDSCASCGVSLLSQSFPNSGFVVQEPPDGVTHREFIGMCAMIAGGNARFDGYNRLEVIPYDFSELGKPGLDGGVFDTVSGGSYQTGDRVDGGIFRPWDTRGTFDGGAFGDRRGLHVLYAFSEGLEIETDDVVITGVSIKGGEGEEWKYGKDGYVLSLENELAAGKEEEAAQLIGEKVVGLRFRPFSGSHVPYPTAEFGDPALLVDRRQNVYKTVITDVSYSYYGSTELKCTAESPIRNSSRYGSREAKAVIASKKLVEKEKTDRERAVEELANKLAHSSGLYMTEDVREDGSTIYYMHDKPTLGESMIIWKLTAEAFGVSTDGGKTYPYGLDATGVAILEKIYAIGISCDYLTTGAFEIKKDGKTMALMDKDTGQVILRPGIFELTSRYFAVTEEGEMYSNDPVAVGYLRMAGTVGSSLSVSGAKRLSANVMQVAFNTSSTQDSGTYSLRVGNVGTQPGGWSISKTELHGNVTAYGDMNVYGNVVVEPQYSKSKAVYTENYGKRLLYCYEMPSPLFGDVGEGKTDGSGECIVCLDGVFMESICQGMEYQVFLQKEGQGDIWVAEKMPGHFTVKGDKHIKFAWEVKAKQVGFGYERLEDPERDNGIPAVDYEAAYMAEIEGLIEEREGAYYETA